MEKTSKEDFIVYEAFNTQTGEDFLGVCKHDEEAWFDVAGGHALVSKVSKRMSMKEARKFLKEAQKAGMETFVH